MNKYPQCKVTLMNMTLLSPKMIKQWQRNHKFILVYSRSYKKDNSIIRSQSFLRVSVFCARPFTLLNAPLLEIAQRHTETANINTKQS